MRIQRPGPHDREFRILFCGVSWPPETFLSRLVDGLTEGGMVVTIATPTRRDRAWLSQRPRVKWLRIPESSQFPPSLLLRAGWIALGALARGPRDVAVLGYGARKEGSRLPLPGRLIQLLPFAGRRWDAIYFPWNSASINFLPLFDLEYPVIVSCRGSQVNVAPHDPRRATLHSDLRTTFGRAAAVHCVSQAMMQEARKYGLNPNKARVIYPSVDPDFFRPAERQRAKGETFRVIATGGLDWRKGYEYALLSIWQLVRMNVPVRLDIIGGGSERQRLVYTIHDLGLQGQVHLRGRLNPPEVRDLMQESNAFLLSSLTEGISNAVLEAMSCGLPVVTTDCGGMREAVTNGMEGFVVPTRDHGAAAAALFKLADDPTLCRQMGRKGRETVLNRFNIRLQVKEFTSLCREVSTQRNSPLGPTL